LLRRVFPGDHTPLGHLPPLQERFTPSVATYFPRVTPFGSLANGDADLSSLRGPARTEARQQVRALINAPRARRPPLIGAAAVRRRHPPRFARAGPLFDRPRASAWWRRRR
jgi:hypothetical protein